jgi:hypothetical protein
MSLEPQKSTVAYDYQDRPELAEIFADSVHSLVFDGQTLRIVFTVNRMEPSPTGHPGAGKRVPTCRLVLSGTAISQLINQIAQFNTTMVQRRAAESASVGGERG